MIQYPCAGNRLFALVSESNGPSVDALPVIAIGLLVTVAAAIFVKALLLRISTEIFQKLFASKSQPSSIEVVRNPAVSGDLLASALPPNPDRPKYILISIITNALQIIPIFIGIQWLFREGERNVIDADTLVVTPILFCVAISAFTTFLAIKLALCTAWWRALAVYAIYFVILSSIVALLLYPFAMYDSRP